MADERPQRHRPTAPLPAKPLGVTAPALNPQGIPAPAAKGQAIAVAAHHRRQRCSSGWGSAKGAPWGWAAPQSGGSEALRRGIPSQCRSKPLGHLIGRAPCGDPHHQLPRRTADRQGWKTAELHQSRHRPCRGVDRCWHRTDELASSQCHRPSPPLEGVPAGAGPPRSGERASGLPEKAWRGPLLLGAWAPGQGDPAKLPQTSRIHEPQQRLPGGEPPGEILRMSRTLQAVEGLGQA